MENIEDIEDIGKTCGRSKMEDHEWVEEELPILRKKLCEWYIQNRRKLPWREGELSEESSEAEVLNELDRGYAIWVSEVMLQQTQVATVIEYYQRWMQRWPTLTSLAEATAEQVTEQWKGLGYYRRARLLLQGAQTVVNSLSGILQRSAAALMKLPSIGPYTAGAIASIAYRQPTPIVDGNVVRVFS